MVTLKRTLLLCSLVIFAQQSIAQTIENPVAITLMTDANTVSPEHPSYVVVQFKIPKGMWMGPEPYEARTPPGTKIVPAEMPGFTFEKAMFPESLKEWVPAKLGTTKVLKEVVNVVVPYSVDQSVSDGNHQLTFYITYTPSYTAGKLSTHVKEAYTIDVSVASGSQQVAIPSPSLEPVSEDFKVQPKDYEDVSKVFRFLFKPWNEESGFVKALHTVWQDPEGHGKTVRIMPFPTSFTTNITGSSVGMGAALFNSTREGTMTGSLSVTASSNDLIGGGFGITAISCPGAYHNYQFGAFFGGESYRDISLKYENYTVADSKFGYNFSFRSVEEPRQRFNGLGNASLEDNETAYRQTLLHTGLDLYSTGIQSFRFGLGLSYDDYDVGTSFEKVRVEEGIDFLQNSILSEGLLGLDGNSRFGVKANLIYDHKDQEFTPAKGLFAKLSLSQNSISNTDNTAIEDNYLGVDLDVRQYFSGPSQKLVGLLRGGLQLKSETNLPFYMLSSLGGPESMRAYDFERFLGKNSFFTSAEIRYSVLKLQVLGYPMDMEMGAFLDVGQIFGDGVDLGDDLKVDPGLSLRFINKPNIGLILTYANGDDGGYVTGGIGLPF